MWGLPIVSQREAVSLGVNAAILSSNAHEGAMLGAMTELLNAGVAVTGLYDVGWTTGTVAAAR
jgi:hypothetical protein